LSQARRALYAAMATGGTEGEHEARASSSSASDGQVVREVVVGEEVRETDEYRISTEFYDSYKQYSALLRSEGEPPKQEQLEALQTQLRVMASNVMRLRLFSPNEELDDINTADLKFLLVPYLLAEVTAATRDMESRLSSLKRALVYWRAFSADCQRLQVAHADDLRAIDRSPEDALDPASKREEKIDRYKRCKELDQKAAYLFSKKREVCGDEFHWGAGGSFDEDMERELVLALLGRAVASVPDQISSTEQELPLLEMMMARGGPGTGPIERPPPAEKPMIVRIQDKAELNKLYREMVFQCPYELPTVTLAEVAEAEMAEMHEREAAKFHHDRRSGADEADRWWSGDRQGAREDAEEEQKIYKDRDWDDWKDDHPWGSGNKNTNMG